MRRTITWIIWILAILAMAYVVVRAVAVPFTVDESVTFVRFVALGNWLPAEEYWNANNHFLNSLLTYWSYSLFGSSEFALRIPNVLAGMLYLVYSQRWAQRMRHPWAMITVFVGLATPHFVLEFFGLCRGYGLSMAFTLVCWYHLANWWKEQRQWDLLIALSAAALATAANLSSLLPHLAYLGIVAIALIGSKSGQMTGWIALVLIGICPVLLYMKASLMLKEGGHLYYGNSDSFWNGTVYSLMAAGLQPWDRAMMPLMPLVVLIALGLLMVAWFRSRQLIWRTDGALVAMIMIACVTGQILANELFGFNHPLDRVALYYIPLAVLAMVLGFDGAQMEPIRTFGWMSTLFVWIFPINTLMTANATHTRLWQWDAGASKFFEFLSNETSNGSRPIVAAHGVLSYSFDHYNHVNGVPLNSIQDHLNGTAIADHHLAYDLAADIRPAYDTALHDAISGQVLFKRKVPIARDLLIAHDIAGPLDTGDAALFLEIDLDTLQNTDLLFEVAFEIDGLASDARAWIVLEAFDRTGANIGYWPVPLEKKPVPVRGWADITDHIVLPGALIDASRARLYIWRIESNDLPIRNVRTKVWSLK